MSLREFAKRWLAPIGFALIFVGYLSVWLPNKAAGLAMLGLEIGEWVKFLPEVQFGQLPVAITTDFDRNRVPSQYRQINLG